MDVEQTCLDWGADKVTIIRALDQLGQDPFRQHEFDSAILDVRLGGNSTVEFARELHCRGIPFVFATGMSDQNDFATRFPGVAIVSKPYSGEELLKMLVAAIDGTELSRSA
ncbi:hypothetical protein BSQ44_23725 [Aquibium oceanicum]|uniref:Response regulatory domain-containing protein n=2 Tax=Aquibium oceanicum TaxID=1670800 RepID=A0A1L3SZJ6_9HYPH|nr:hypothetical protein BSQ44_23725 [Aquibium oceanicum]